MDIYIGADHRGFTLKEKLREWLQGEGHNVTDVGATQEEADDDYPDYGAKVAEAVAEAPDKRRGVVLCGSGVGMAVVANKVIGTRAALVHDAKLAEAARRDDDINILALGADFISEVAAKGVVTAFLSTPFSGEDRHVRRVQKITTYENGGDGLCDCEHCEC